MSRREPTPLRLPDAARKPALASIKRFFDEELDQEIGDLKAALVLDYLTTEFGPAFYNAAIADAKAFFEERAADLGAIGTRDEFPFWAKPGKAR